ncbi:hypothetical protein ARMSODRAFT_622465 [Armillaria solidipes]|uniref:Uncharacterized protein n=1 Tax=Armillaria solidipes TaxID=1076256 RepID=A0A2H3BBA0_9AGAR|nr:hypothetical protein ARMSODRAFT_622465 [Armillaria solidipes]
MSTREDLFTYQGEPSEACQASRPLRQQCAHLFGLGWGASIVAHAYELLLHRILPGHRPALAVMPLRLFLSRFMGYSCASTANCPIILSALLYVLKWSLFTAHRINMNPFRTSPKRP